MALTLVQIRNKADAILAPLAAAIQARQDVWILTHANYWQGQRTPSSVPADGADVAPDAQAKPSGADDASWSDFAVSLPATVSALLAVDNHSGPLGKGYTMSATVTFQGRTFYRSLGVGPYSTTLAWTELL